MKKLKKIKSHWNERWRKVETKYPTARNEYYISDYGRIKSIEKITGEERLLNGSKAKSGHILLNIHLKEGKRASIRIHKFVSEQFIKKSEEDKLLERNFVNHINGDKSNNHFSNLRNVNQKELTEIHKERGIISEERNRKTLNTKMTSTSVSLLKKRLKAGKTKKKILARTFNISMMQVRRIEKGENWGNVK